MFVTDSSSNCIQGLSIEKNKVLSCCWIFHICNASLFTQLNLDVTARWQKHVRKLPDAVNIRTKNRSGGTLHSGWILIMSLTRKQSTLLLPYLSLRGGRAGEEEYQILKINTEKNQGQSMLLVLCCRKGALTGGQYLRRQYFFTQQLVSNLDEYWETLPRLKITNLFEFICRLPGFF